MTNMSQTVDDVIKQSKKNWENISVDRPLGDRARELFESARTKIDPQIYKGEYKSKPPSYNSESNKQKSPVKLQEKMYNKSMSVKEWIANERYEAEKNLPPNQRGYNFKRDTAGNTSYNSSFEDVAKQYLMGEGKELYTYLSGKERDFYDITAIGTDLEGRLPDDAIAALATNGVTAALIGSKDFDRKASQFAAHYGISVDRAVTYLLSHEFVHASQKGKYFDDPILAELDVEHTLKEYFTQKGDKDLADVASDRAANVTRNYGGSGAYNMPKGISERGGLESYIGKGAGGEYSSSAGGKSSASDGASAGNYAAAN